MAKFEWMISHFRGNMKLVVIMALLLLSTPALADVKVEGWKDLNYDYNITNISDYPDYVFLTSSNIWGWKHATMINSSGSFGGGYKLDDYIVHAAIRSDFDMDSLFHYPDEYEPNTFNCTDYCQNNSKIVSSSLLLPKSTPTEETLGLEKIDVFLKIDNITNQSLNISKVKTLYYYGNGTVQELAP